MATSRKTRTRRAAGSARGTRLLIVESPAKAKTIEKYLGDEFVVRASIGHIRDLPKNNKKAIDIKGGFVPHYEISPGKEDVVLDLRRAAKKASEVLLATDPDREGEAIAWHIVEACDLPRAKRVVFHEITREAVTEALAHPRAIDQHLKTAQEARRVLDRLVGYDLSGLIWKKVRYGLSAGRVQSPALRIIMEREREIRAFRPEKYYVVTAEMKTSSGEKLLLTCVEEPREEAVAQEIVSKGTAGSWRVAEVKETEVTRSPRPPFITSTLQQAASSRLGFTPSRTMGIAQKLYESGLITYMRTDSTALSPVAQPHILAEIAKRFGKHTAVARVYKTKSKNAQEAHEAIRPTDPSRASAGVSEDQKKLYRLIWQRTLASQMADAKILRTKITANIEGGTIPDFAVTGSRIAEAGWIAADPDAREEDVSLPRLSAQEPLDLIRMESEGKETQPPGRYSEAGLVKELEKRGIGRPSTYASIIKTIIDRGYVTKEGRSLAPTDTGDVVSTFLEAHFAKYISDTFTAEMEDELDEIARGKRGYVKTLTDFYTPFRRDVAAKEDIEKLTTLGEAEERHRCPLCGGGMVIKLGRSGKFLSCARFPDCSGARTITGEELAGPRDTGEACPECKTGKLVERDGKFGRFIACGNYPKCRYVKKDAAQDSEGNVLNGTGVPCPLCTKGELVSRKGRFGIFYSCSRYPACTYAIKAKPTGTKCDSCGALMMEGTKTIPERCSNKACPNHNPHKLEKLEK